jgi:phosphotransacetylase
MVGPRHQLFYSSMVKKASNFATKVFNLTRNSVMNKFEAIRRWAEDKDSPIILFVNGRDPEVIKIAKALIAEEVADIMLLGDELEVYEACRMYRLNETLLYGVVNPADHAEMEYYIDLYMDDTGEEDPKKAAKMVKKPEVLAELMYRDEVVDLVVVDLASWTAPEE